MLANLLNGAGIESSGSGGDGSAPMSGGWRRRHLKVCRVGSRRCYNDNCVRTSSRRYRTTARGRKCRIGSRKCRDNRCHKRRVRYSRRIQSIRTPSPAYNLHP